jgi:hypothetical protein
MHGVPDCNGDLPVPVALYTKGKNALELIRK